MTPTGGRGKADVTRHKVGPRDPDMKLGRSPDEHTLRASLSLAIPDGGCPLPRPLPVPVHQAIWRRYQDGQDGPTIAAALGLAPRTVRKLIRRFRQQGKAAVMPS